MSIKGINNVGSESNNDATLTGNLSANAKLLSDLTPPVTPDSTPMSIGNSPNFKQQPASFLLLNQSLVTKKNVRIMIIIIDTGFNFAISFFLLSQYNIFQQVCLSGCVRFFFPFLSLLFCLYRQRKSNIPHQTKCRNGTLIMTTIFSSIWMVWIHATVICHK